MAQLKYPTTSPPGGFKYRQTETGLVIIGDSLQDLVNKVVSHRQYKGLKPDDGEMVLLEVQRQICARLGESECIAEDGDDWVPMETTKRFTLEDILAASNAMLEFVKSGMSLVPIEEAKRRRKICQDCMCNRPASGCKCSFLYKAINASVPKERRSEDLHICRVCNCSLNAKTNVPMNVLKTDQRKLSYPSFCWMRDQ